MPEKVGRFELLDKLGEGGMGIVYRGFDTLMQRHVAIKTFSLDPGADPRLRERLLREAVAVSRLSHENIVTVHELFEQDGRTYLVMELLEGQDLVKAVHAGQLRSLERKVWVLREVCKGLGHAHAKGIVHRDVKPANIFIARDQKVKLVDFGIARLSTTALTETNTRVGTPFYMSPEQWSGEEVDPRSDIFSLGVVLYELLSGRKPFDSHSPAVVGYQVTTKDPKPVHSLNPAIPERLGRIVAKTLAKAPADRYQSAEALAEDLFEVETSLEREMPELSRKLETKERELLALLAANKEALEHPLVMEILSHPDAELVDQRLLARIRFVESAPTTKASLPEGYLELQIALENLHHQCERVLSLLKRLETLEPALSEIEALRSQGKLELALKKSKELIEHQPGLPRLQAVIKDLEHALGLSRVETGDGSRDIQERERRVQELLDQSRGLDESGEKTEAFSRLTELLDLDPEHREARALRDATEAEVERTQRRDRTEILLRRARDAEREERLEDALELASSVLREEPGQASASELARQLRQKLSRKHRRRDTTEVLLEEAKTLDRDGQHDKALETLNTILQVDSGHRPALDLKQRIEAQRDRRRRGSSALRRWISAGGLAAVSALVLWNILPESDRDPSIPPPSTTSEASTSSIARDVPVVTTSETPTLPPAGTTTHSPPPTSTAQPRPTTTLPPPPETTSTIPLVVAEPEPPAPEPEPSPVTNASLTVSTTPTAMLALDGTPRGITPLTLEVEPGVHRVVLTAQDGFRWEEQVELIAGDRTILSRGMAAFGSLSVTSPIWVDVSLGGNPSQQTPLFFDRLPVGHHTVIASRPGYQSQVHTITIEEGQTTGLTVELVKQP